jgi:NADH-quinone oxidoreductase subunit N
VALKTYLLGALLGIALLLGVTVLYGVGGATAYASLEAGLVTAPPAALAVGIVGVLGGLMCKAGGVPGHFWVPDVAQGAGTTAAAFLTTVPKVGALVAAFRLLDAMPATVEWPLLVAVLAAASMTLGNLAAFAQTDPRRLLRWSGGRPSVRSATFSSRSPSPGAATWRCPRCCSTSPGTP